MIVIKMDVHAGHDVALEVMLNVRKLPGEIADVVVVDERDRSDGITLRITTPFLTHQLVPNEVAQRFGPRRIFPPPDDVIEVIKQMVIQRDAETNELFHTRCYDYIIRATQYSSEMQGSQLHGIWDDERLFAPDWDVQNGSLTVDQEQRQIA